MIKKTLLLLIGAILFNTILSVFVWLDHSFVTGLNPFLGVIAVLLSLLIGIPLAIFAIKKLIRYCKGWISFTPDILFALAFFIFSTAEPFVGPLFGPATIDIQLHDTYFVIANTHIMILLAVISLVFSAVYAFYPAVTGRVLNAPMGYIHFWITLIGFCLIGWPSHYEGLAGMPRRYLDYSNWNTFDRFAGINVFRMKVSILLIGAQLLFIINLIYSAVKGKRS
jgi:cytochrome c oxidase subunit 1